MKNTISDGMKMFRKYQLAVWRSIQIFYSHFTKVTCHTTFFAKNKLSELTDHKAGLFYATSMEGSSQNSDKVSGSKGGKCKFHDVWKSIVAHL
jgi:hypothetical protein